MLPHRPFASFLQRNLYRAMIVLCTASLLGLAGCGIDIVQNAGSNTNANSSQGGGKGGQGNNTTQSRQWRYNIRGVAMVAFYPTQGESSPALDPSRGTMNGYMVFFEKPQETVISAWSLKDGECKFEVEKYGEQSSGGEVVRGLNGGKELSVTVAGKRIVLEPRTQELEGTELLSYVYNIPTQNSYAFPYNQMLRYESKGGPEVQAFRSELKAPAKVSFTRPQLIEGQVSLPRNKDAQFAWNTEGETEYLAFRINQNRKDKKEVHSLFCRLANNGKGVIPSAQLQKLAADPDGSFTTMFVFATTNKFVEVKGFDAPILTVARATSSISIKLP